MCTEGYNAEYFGIRLSPCMRLWVSDSSGSCWEHRLIICSCFPSLLLLGNEDRLLAKALASNWSFTNQGSFTISPASGVFCNAFQALWTVLSGSFLETRSSASFKATLCTSAACDPLGQPLLLQSSLATCCRLLMTTGFANETAFPLLFLGYLQAVVPAACR